MKSQSPTLRSTLKMPGFSLVELMVALVIIIILASFVFVGTSRMRAAANRAISVDNLRRLQVANGLYATDNNGVFVSTFTQSSSGKTGGLWDRNAEFLDLYIGASEPTSGNQQESRVASKHLDPTAFKAKASGFDTLKASYGMVSKENYKSGNKDVDSAYRLTQITKPSQTAAFVTAVNWLVQYSGRKGWDGIEGKINAPRIAFRYGNKALVAYYDGHVGEVTEEDLAEFDRRGGKRHAFWSGGIATR